MDEQPTPAFPPARGGRQEGHGVKIENLEVARAALETGHGVQVHGAPATGLPLHTNGNLGADILFVRGGDEFPVHTHPGDHLLYCLAGHGTITVAGITYKIKPGDIYMVEGMIPHAVGAETDHVLVAIGSPHKPVDAPDRMTWVDWDGNPLLAPLAPAGRAADLTLDEPIPYVPTLQHHEGYADQRNQLPDPRLPLHPNVIAELAERREAALQDLKRRAEEHPRH